MKQSGGLMKKLFGGGAAEDVAHRSSAENIYHCCVHKTASQWIARILSAEETYRGCGLRTHRYQRELPGGADTRKISERTFDKPFPPHTIVTPIYVGWENFTAIPKPPSWRAFFVMRDPRDVLVSWYFSWKHSHPVMGDVGEQREKLKSNSEEDGLCYGIEQLSEQGLFAALRSWMDAPKQSANVAVFRYEDLIDVNQLAVFQKLFAHCDIAMTEPLLRELLAANSFAALAKGRERGTEDVTSHLRKGVHGDWKNHFTPRVRDAFRGATNDLVEVLGYEW
jgi:hypothetical protein